MWTPARGGFLAVRSRTKEREVLELTQPENSRCPHRRTRMDHGKPCWRKSWLTQQGAKLPPCLTSPLIRKKCCKCCAEVEKEDKNLDYGTYYYDAGERRQDVVEVAFDSFLVLLFFLSFLDTQLSPEPTPVSWSVRWSHFQISNLWSPHYFCTTSALLLHYFCTTSALLLHYFCTTY